MSSVRKRHLIPRIRGKIVLYTWRGNRHRHAILYLFGLYLPVWR
jgi:hypothetical protein